MTNLSVFGQGTLLRIAPLPTGRYLTKVIWPRNSTHEAEVEIEADRGTTNVVSFNWAYGIILQVDRPVAALLEWWNFGTNISQTIPAGGSVTLPWVTEGEREFRITANRYHPVRTNLYIRAARGEPNIIYLQQSMYPLAWNDYTNAVTGMKLVWLEEGNCWIGRTEVTKGQFTAFVEESGGDMAGMKCLTATGLAWFAERSFRNPDPQFPAEEDHPVVGVNWHDAVKYCEWLTQKERQNDRLLPSQAYRLPTAAQWQYASSRCLANNPEARERGNFAGAEVLKGPWPTNWNFLARARPRGDDYPRTAPVGKSDPPAQGFDVRNLFDNVQEWCLDDYSQAGNNPQLVRRYGPPLEEFTASGKTPGKVVCGGSWYDHDEVLWRTDSRHAAVAKERTDFRGFRVVVVQNEVVK
jgi:formylglycine-generating enzyme required for sulfatase activity